jgi:hypothetical protein
MKKNIIITLLGLGILMFGFAAEAVVPQYINYQGVLKDSAGNPLTGDYSMVFKIYDAVSGGTAIYNATGTATTVAVSEGLYNVQLGPVDATTVFTGQNRWLDIKVGGEQLSPRLKINSVAYAITADLAWYAYNADKVDGIDATTEASAAAGKLYALDSGGKLSGIPVSAEANTSDGFALFINNTNNGKIGVKTAGAGTSSGDPTIGAVGTGVLPQNILTGVTIYNNAITPNSIILLSIGHAASPSDDGSEEPLKVTEVNTSQKYFKVNALDGTSPAAYDTPFCYIIIN